jgi:hypothetical protein
MTTLALVIQRWDPKPWVERFAAYAPELDVVIWPDDGTTIRRRSITRWRGCRLRGYWQAFQT